MSSSYSWRSDAQDLDGTFSAPRHSRDTDQRSRARGGDSLLCEGAFRGTKIEVSEEQILLGSAGTLLANRHWLNSDSSFWIFYSDVLTAANLAPLQAIHQRHSDHLASLGVNEVPDPRRCGIVSVDRDGVIRDFVEKPEEPTGSLAFSGIMIARRQMLDLIPSDGLADIAFHVLPKLVGRMSAIMISDYLLDIGTMENYQRAQETWPGFANLSS